MDGYLLFSHGSLLCGAGQALDAHAERLRARFGGAPVEVGYLNYSDPEVEVGVERLISAGADRIVVLPYFLVPGYFVTNSLPKRLAEVEAQYPGVKFTVAEALGEHELLADALIEAAEESSPPMSGAAEVYAAAATSCRARPDCPLFGTARCPASKVQCIETAA